MLIELGLGKRDAAPARPGLALIGGGEDVRHADGVELLVRVLEEGWADAVAGPERHGQEPVAITEHGGFVERAAVGEAHGSGPHGLGIIGVVAAGVPIAAAAVEVAEALIEEEPEAAERIGPQIADERPSLRGVRADRWDR